MAQPPTDLAQQVLRRVLAEPAAKDSPEKILEIIDEFAQTTPLMVVGRQKGQVVLDAVRAHEPTIMVELGGFVGYSAILFGAELARQNRRYGDGPSTPARYYSFELSAAHAAVARRLVAYAGLASTVEFIVGAAGKTLPLFQQRLKTQFCTYVPADLVFMDHATALYVSDFRVLESQGLIAPGTVVVANSVFGPGATEYVQYVQSSPEYRRDHNQRTRNSSNPECEGRWNLLYDSQSVPVSDARSGRKDALEVTRCVSYLSG